MDKTFLAPGGKPFVAVDVAADYAPVGFTEIEAQPTANHQWQNGKWVEVLPPPVDLSSLDQASLNEALAAEGSVVRALALVLLQEINTLRSKVIPPLPAYNTTQLVAALKAKMR